MTAEALKVRMRHLVATVEDLPPAQRRKFFADPRVVADVAWLHVEALKIRPQPLTPSQRRVRDAMDQRVRDVQAH